MYITIEGIDGCGKSTVINELKRKLENVHFTAEPRDDVKREISISNPYRQLVLMLDSRKDVIEKDVIPYIDKDIAVISDRGYDSSVAYQGYAMGCDIDIINRDNEVAMNGIVPDLTIYLDIPAELSLERTGKRTNQQDELDKQSVEFYSKVRNGYLEIAKNNKARVKVIDATQPVDKVVGEVLDLIG